ncbi:Putative vacuolar membrane transporter for cationic amino acids [Savitreella phatthalungensis]
MPPLNYFSNETFSSILGSISITAWIVVFAPQIYTNFHHKSADGLSLSFVVIWLLGDLFNIVGAWLQDVMWVMIVLAIYYTLADIVLLVQCVIYRRKDATLPSSTRPVGAAAGHVVPGDITNELADPIQHASVATPLIPKKIEITRSRSTAKSALLNICALLAVCTVGTVAWYVGAVSSAPRYSEPARPPPSSGPNGRHGHGLGKHHEQVTLAVAMDLLASAAGAYKGPVGRMPSLEWNIAGQIFGWMCAVTYLGSRLPQILHNWRRKSTEGLSSLFFMFACLGNLTYVGSILVRMWDTPYLHRYLAINASWLAGSAGTLWLDFIILAQTLYYRSQHGKSIERDTEELDDDDQEQSLIRA